MRLFLYEFITGGGLLAETPPESLLREGKAMISALAADALALNSAEVALLWDHRLPPLDLPGIQLHVVTNREEADAALRELSAAATWTLLIAPETAGILLAQAETIRAAGGRLLAPPAEILALCSDKHRTAECLLAGGIAAPRGMILPARMPPPADFSYPAVRKPIDGCGSQDIEWISDQDAALPPRPYIARLESFAPGRAASVAAVCGVSERFALPGCWQRLANDGTFAYLGGSLPLPPPLAERAERLALRAVDCVAAQSAAPTLGYLGVDLVLGEADDGSEDVVIEVNPRLTTSYVGLRHAVQENLLQAMLDAASSRPVALTRRETAVQFAADGQVFLGE